jgi:hypothetical protein
MALFQRIRLRKIAHYFKRMRALCIGCDLGQLLASEVRLQMRRNGVVSLNPLLYS